MIRTFAFLITIFWNNLNFLNFRDHCHLNLISDSCSINFILNDKDDWPSRAFGSISMKNTQIFGIGEVSHGGIEPIQFKVQLIKYLIAFKGYNLILFEYPDLEIFEPMRRYIMSSNNQQYKLNGCENIIRKMVYLPHFYQDMLIELVDWIRLYNLNHKNQVRFYGFDFLYKKDFYNFFISNYLRKVDVNLAKRLETNWLKVEPSNDFKYNYLFNYFYNNKKLFIEKKLNIDQINFEFSCELSRMKYLALKKDDEINHYNKHPEINFRDSILAENIKFLAKNNKTILWAHNNHIINKSGLTGYYLKKWLKDKYYSVVTDFSVSANVEVGNIESEKKGERVYIIKHIFSFQNSTVSKLFKSFKRTNCILFEKFFRNKQLLLNEIDLFGRHYLLQVNERGFNALAVFDSITTK